ncbi:MAG TPA: NADH-quinone oxidoreductase subunit NuoG [Candidatus Binatia bacterium]|nr:NADH-quinone oxidoreductase subunit NuoG [Candidatus Binatia bacterium]
MAADASPTPAAAAPPPDDGRVAVNIDGRALRVPRGTLILDAATQAGIHIPIYCAHPKMEPVAVCRMCLVQVEKLPKLQPACATVVSDGMVVTTRSPQVVKEQEGVLEFLLLNHPLDCPVCDRGGECDLQDFTVRYGPPTSRFPITEKVHFNKAVRLSDRIELDQERCILCWRCTRYYEEITGEKELVLQERGVHTLIAPFNDQPLRSEFQGNLPEICPVGALTHIKYRFRARPWDLQRSRSICPECSYGCNINVDARDFEVKRFASRDNPLVDDMWLCDRGRYSFPRWNSTDRIRRPMVGGRGEVAMPATLEEAVAQAARQLAAVRDERGGAAIGVLASAESTNEELWLLQRLAREVLDTPNLDHQLEAFPGLAAEEHELGIAEIEECRAVAVLGPEPERQAPVLTLRLFKAATKRGVAVRRLDTGAGARAAVEAVGGGEGLVGVIADETDRALAADVTARLRAAGATVKRLTVTRGVNGRGAKDMGMLPGLLPGYRAASPAGMSGREILEAAMAGRIAALLTVNAAGLAVEDRDQDLLRRAVARAEVVVALESRPGPVSESATVLIPGHSLMEKLGTVTSSEGRVQRIRAALPPATATPAETRVLSMLAADLGHPGWPAEPTLVQRAIAGAVPAYAEAGNGGRAVFVAVPA